MLSLSLPGSCAHIRRAGPRGRTSRSQHRNVWVKASKDGKGKTPDDKTNSTKADFSAYWSMKVREWFSERRHYLEDKSAADDLSEPEFIKKLAKDVEQRKQDMKRRREELASKRREAVGPEGMAQLRELSAAALQSDLDQARGQLHSIGVQGVALTLYRARTLVQNFLLLPITLAKAIFAGWQHMFQSHRYENFLMSEGENIWYWRNRTENERWFWEIYFWDRILAPLIITIAYEYLVPNNFVWAVVVPMTFVMWYTGELLGPRNLEFWYIAYFGFYKKCWADFLGLLSLVFVW